MWALEIIGWAFLAGCAVTAFVAPIYALDAWFKARVGKTERGE